MKLPKLSPLQSAVLDSLVGGELSAKALRAEMSIRGAHKRGPAFYQLVARLEDAGFLEISPRPEPVEGRYINERYYKITPPGKNALQETVAFFHNLTAKNYATDPNGTDLSEGSGASSVWDFFE